jgi:hypothetical protein
VWHFVAALFAVRARSYGCPSVLIIRIMAINPAKFNIFIGLNYIKFFIINEVGAFVRGQ